MSTPSTHPNCASDERGYQRIRFRQDTAENWLKNDPILASGEMGYVIGATEGPNLKVGDGWVRWSQLPWIASGDGTAGPPGPEGPPGHDAQHIVSEVEPPPGEEIGDLWIDPTATTETATVTVDLSAYATTDYVDATKAEIIAAVTPALQERYTKQEVDAKVAALQQGVTDANLGVQGVADLIPFVAGELGTQIDAKLAGKADQSEFSAFQGQYGTLESEFREYFRLLNQGFATVAQKPDVDAALDLKADKTTVGSLAKTLMDSIMEVKDGTYTKPEVDEAIAALTARIEALEARP
jgi:hypothetical protein